MTDSGDAPSEQPPQGGTPAGPPPQGETPAGPPPPGETPAGPPYQGGTPAGPPYQPWASPGQPGQPWAPTGQAYGQVYGQPYTVGQPYGAPMFPAPAAGPTHYSLDGPAAALTVLLAADAVASLIGTVLAGGTIAAVLLYLPLVPVFLVWFYRARKNADGRGQLQRHSPGWAIGAWFVPFVNLVFPFQIMTGIWRANEPEDRRSRAVVLVGFWWGCWLGGGILREVGSRLGSTSAGPARGANILADVLTAAAAILLFVIVRAITRGPVGGEPVRGSAKFLMGCRGWATCR
jgi:Domain of unknown function (DUF4328)